MEPKMTELASSGAKQFVHDWFPEIHQPTYDVSTTLFPKAQLSIGL